MFPNLNSCINSSSTLIRKSVIWSCTCITDADSGLTDSKLCIICFIIFWGYSQILLFTSSPTRQELEKPKVFLKHDYLLNINRLTSQELLDDFPRRMRRGSQGVWWMVLPHCPINCTLSSPHPREHQWPPLPINGHSCVAKVLQNRNMLERKQYRKWWEPWRCPILEVIR